MLVGDDVFVVFGATVVVVSASVFFSILVYFKTDKLQLQIGRDGVHTNVNT
jgi:hypothetical protein